MLLGGGCEGSGGGLFWSGVGSGRILDRHGLWGIGVSGLSACGFPPFVWHCIIV